MISKVPKRPEAYSIAIDSSSENLVKRYNLKEMDQIFVTVVPPTSTYPLVGNQVKQICMGKICCSFFVKYSTYDIPEKKFGYSYRFSIYNGKAHDADSEESYCSIVACTEDSEEKCGSRFFPSDNLVPSVKFSEVKISMTIELGEDSGEDLMMMPSNLDFRLLPLRVDKFDYTAGRVYNESR